MKAMEILPLPAFRDNYIWALREGTKAVVVDPGEPAPVEQWLEQHGLTLHAVLITHHHPDHVGGVRTLKTRYQPTVFGPAAEQIAGVDIPLRGDDVARPGAGFPEFDVIDVPGHTAGHIAYHGSDLLFCGDTLFSGGCGRLFEGTAEQMHRSLRRLAALPEQTRVYAAHEYTAANLRFALEVLPRDAELRRALANALKIMENGRQTLPSTIAREHRINVFLRCDEADVRSAAERWAGTPLSSEVEVFASLRRWKDQL